jgi:hypothetical protein
VRSRWRWRTEEEEAGGAVQVEKEAGGGGSHRCRRMRPSGRTRRSSMQQLEEVVGAREEEGRK